MSLSLETLKEIVWISGWGKSLNLQAVESQNGEYKKFLRRVNKCKSILDAIFTAPTNSEKEISDSEFSRRAGELRLNPDMTAQVLGKEKISSDRDLAMSMYAPFFHNYVRFGSHGKAEILGDGNSIRFLLYKAAVKNFEFKEFIYVVLIMEFLEEDISTFVGMLQRDLAQLTTENSEDEEGNYSTEFASKSTGKEAAKSFSIGAIFEVVGRKFATVGKNIVSGRNRGFAICTLISKIIGKPSLSFPRVSSGLQSINGIKISNNHFVGGILSLMAAIIAFLLLANLWIAVDSYTDLSSPKFKDLGYPESHYEIQKDIIDAMSGGFISITIAVFTFNALLFFYNRNLENILVKLTLISGLAFLLSFIVYKLWLHRINVLQDLNKEDPILGFYAKSRIDIGMALGEVGMVFVLSIIFYVSISFMYRRINS